MTPDESDRLYAYRAAMHPHHSATAEEVELWARLLADVPYEPAQQALDDHYRSTSTPIMPADIRAAVLRAAGVMAPDHGAAWSEAMNECSLARRDNRPPQWSHPAIGEAVRAVGGVFAVCSNENLSTLAAQFRDAYRAAATRVDRQALTTPYDAAVAALAAPVAVAEVVTASDNTGRVLELGGVVRRLDDV